MFILSYFELNTQILISLGDDSVAIGKAFHINIIYQ